MVFVGTFLLSAESSGGIGAIGLDVRELIFQIINFAILFWVLKKVAYKPIITVLENRRKRIEESLELARQIEQDKKTLEEYKERTMKEARAEAAEILAKNRLEGAEVIKRAEAKAGEQSAKLVEQAHRRIEQEVESARTGLKREVAGLVVAATEAVLVEKVDKAKDEALIERAVARVEATK